MWFRLHFLGSVRHYIDGRVVIEPHLIGGKLRIRNGILLAAASALFGLAPHVLATNIFIESGDAGQTLLTAQIVNTLPGGTTVDQILGNLDSSDADIFQIYLPGGQTFSATTVNNTTFLDSELFLFNSAGIGVYANDDDPDNPPQSTLPNAISFTPSIAGIYYLAIAGSSNLPESSAGYIFPVSGGLLDQTNGIDNAVGPTGPGGAVALQDFIGASSETGAYEIDLTGAQFVPSAVPEPSSEFLLGGGILLIAALGKKFRRAK